jgi:hypothetical protein
MQLIHLLLADLLWIALVLLSAAVLEESAVSKLSNRTTENRPLLSAQ